mmetsp:Transcript_17078/g.25868  ORF Transcript_17078/g.25868 Transcript_17078/m.25868 type:complete len:297 (+) Transcript_17078:266-1156(+)
MNSITEFIGSFSIVHGFLALLHGLSGSVSSSKIRNTYFRFIGYFLMITILSYTIISATITGTIVLWFLLILGPILGPIVLFGLCSFIIFSLFVLWIMGQFPTSLFMGSYGILQPFFSATQVSYLLAALLIPKTCEEFVLDGIDVLLWKQHTSKGEGSSLIRQQYSRRTWTQRIWLLCYNFLFAVTIRFWVFLLLGRGGIIHHAVAAFVAGSQLVSVYTVSIQKQKFLTHVRWCFFHAFRIIGFMLPLQLLQSHEGMMSRLVSFLWLGFTYSASAQLLEPLVKQDLSLLSDQKQKHL